MAGWLSACNVDEQRRLTEIAGRIRSCKNEVVGKLLEIGEHLQRAHKILDGKKPGAFAAWAAMAPVALKKTQAHAYLAAYRQFNDCPKITHQLSDRSLLTLAGNEKACEEAKAIVTRGDTLTTKDVQELLAKHKESVAKPAEIETLTDANGAEVPTKFRSVFESVSDFAECESLLRQARVILKRLAGKKAGQHIKAAQGAEQNLEKLIDNIHAATPYALTEDGTDWIPVGKS